VKTFNLIINTIVHNYIFVFRLIQIVLVFLLGFNVKAQDNGKLILEKIDPTCSGNGQVSASLEDAENASQLNFTLYLSQEPDPVGSSPTGVFQNLQAGKYKVEASFMINGEAANRSAEIILESLIAPLSYTILAENLCRSDLGSMEVVTLRGNPETYQIIDGPVTRPLQTSPIFEDLPEGVYTILVEDECGDRLSQTFQIQNAAFLIDNQLREFVPTLASCESIKVGHYIRSVGADISYPLEMTFTITRPDGLEEIFETEITEGDAQEGFIFGDIPYFPGEPYQYDLTVVDICGQTASLTDQTIDRQLSISNDLFWGAGDCGQRKLSIKPENFSAPYTLNILSHPEEFDPEVFNADYPGPFTEENTFFGSDENPIPPGFYEIEILDACGRQAGVSRTFTDELPRPRTNAYKGCGPATGSLQIFNYDYELIKVELIAAPAAYANSLPLDLSENVSVTNKKTFYLNNLPKGEYQFKIATSCGSEHTSIINIEEMEVTDNQIEIIENCGSFNLRLNHSDNLATNQTTRFGLQKLDLETGLWVNPETGTPYVEGDEINSENSVVLTNGATNINLNYFGDLRVVKSVKTWRNGADIQPNQPSYSFCLQILSTFNIKERSIFENINTFQCVDEQYELSVSASGYEPFTYKIVSKNNQPFLVDNGEDPLFQNLEAGRYQLQLEDGCGNLTNTTIQIIGENLPKIVPENLCEGENGKLIIKNNDFLQFEWYRDDDPENILSTSPELDFSPFDLANDQGLYKVRLSASNLESCLNEVLEFDINEESLNPKPGIGLEVQVCQGDIVDLFDFLEGPYSDFGNWEEISNSGALIGNIWSSLDLLPGSYEFEYSISGICSGENSTRVTIDLNENPPIPIGPALQEFCASEQPVIENLTAEGEDVLWYLSDFGGEPLDGRLELESGTSYYAEQRVNGCNSERLQVNVIIYDPLNNQNIQAAQTLFQMEVPEILTGSVPQGGKGGYNYQWEMSTSESAWEPIDGANEKDFQPQPLMVSTSFRRKTIDEFCGEYYSNEILIAIEIAEIIANDEVYGPLKNYEAHVLESILTNDSLKGAPIQEGEVSINVTSTIDDQGNPADIGLTIDENGSILLPSGTPDGNFVVTYELCQALVPGNCDTGQVSLWIAAIDLDIRKELDKTQAVVGEMTTFTITVTNNSPYTLDNIRIEDLLPESLFFISASMPPQEDIVWILDDFESDEVFETQLEVMPMQEGEFTNEVNVKTGDVDATVQSETLFVRPKSVDLSVTKISTDEQVRDGDPFTYQIQVENNGLDPASEIRVIDQLPDGLIFTDVVIEVSDPMMNVGFSQTQQQLEWEIDIFPVGASMTILLTVTADQEGLMTNRIAVSSEEDDANPQNNNALDEKTILPLFIPNVIKPDGDGKNDEFIVRASHKYDKIDLLIFNRWGDLVFTAEDYDNNWSAEGLLGGTYYYQIKGINNNGGIKQYKGWLQVIK
jgi:uncharacterized repeat protein (TIGR01451 family)/gliding motility-associated-like protein